MYKQPIICNASPWSRSRAPVAEVVVASLARLGGQERKQPRRPQPPSPETYHHAFSTSTRKHTEKATREQGMHLYNAWLPPAVADASRDEAAAFTGAVRAAGDAWRAADPESAYATLKWISVFDLFIKAKSDVAPEDVHALVELGFEIFHASQNKFIVQIKWGGLLIRLFKKHGKRLSLGVQWRPLYDTLIRTHFKRNMGPEGWKVKQQHFETVTSLVRASRSFFPEGAAAEIWSEFRPLLENPWHNSAFEGVGFLRLFLPANSRNQDHFTTDWIAQCLDIWDSVTNCNFWDIQWASIIARCIKNSRSVEWEKFLPLLFTRYLNMFEVPISGNGSYPFPLEVPRNTRFLFSSKSRSPSKAVAKSVVYLLKRKSLALEQFEKLINFLEQFYHPSNGGRWTYSLEHFLRYLVHYFERRLQHEQFDTMEERNKQFCLGKEERAAFMKVVLKLLDRGQYSKDDSLAETVSIATSILSYVEPSFVIPFVATSFQLALETTTATHQLKNAVTSVAFSGRALLLSSLCSSQSDDSSTVDTSNDLIVTSLSNALLGLDANDPPKTIATMQLIASIFSNLATVGVSDDVPAFLQTSSLSNWLDEFFCRLFSVLQNLESSSPINEGYQASIMSGTFLVEDSPYYFCMLEILLGKLSKPLFNQSVKKIAKFVNANILPGATSEVGLLCCACVHSYPEEASVYLVKPILMIIMSSFEGTPTTGYVGREIPDKTATKATLSPALETALDYYLRVLAISISYTGPVLLNYREELKHIIMSAFQAPSWKVNGAGDHLLRSLLGNLVSYYPVDQYKPFSCHPIANIIEPWGCSKAHQDREAEMLNFRPKWHDPSEDELSFANELLEFHFQSALEDLLTICQMHSETGNEKEHLKVTLLRIHSALQGVMSCLPEMRPSYKDGRSKVVESIFFIAGSAGSTVGSSEMREKAAEIVHIACRYLLKERTDDSILLALVVRVIDALVNYGSLEYDEWSSHVQAWKLESAAIIEPPCNFIVPFHAQGKKRPRWALVDKAHLHNTWRCSQSSYHRYRTNADVSPSSLMINLMNDLLDLSLHNYETVRSYAGRSLTKLLKRWSSLISNCVLTLTENLRNSKALEHVVLGSCSILASQTVLRHLTTDSVSLSSFIMGILESSHHESLKCQKAINELFVKYNIRFSGISRNFFKNSESQADKPGFLRLFSQINALGFETNSLHWRYNLMANRVLLLLILASRSESDIYSKILAETAGHFLRNLKSQLPHSRMLAISALNTLLQGSPNKASVQDPQQSLDHPTECNIMSTGEILNEIIREEGFMNDTLNSLSHVHIISDNDGSSKASYGASSFQSGSDKAITYFYFDFSASWPCTPSWISLVGSGTFYSSFARIFKRLIQQCGMPVISSLQTALEEFLSSKERSRQCVAAEAMAGMLHSDVTGNSESANDWLMLQLQKIVLAPSVESVPEWAACIRYAVTGKERSGTRAPVLRQKVLDCLCTPVPQSMATSILAKRYSFLSVALIEISPRKMSLAEEQYHVKILNELLDNMSHSSAQVREAIGVAMCIACSNVRLAGSCGPACSPGEVCGDVSMTEQTGNEYWSKTLTDGATELSVSIQNSIQSKQLESTSDSAIENGLDNKEADAKRMETIFHFMIASLKSGRSSVLLDVIIGLIYAVLSLQETSNKDLSLLAKSSFELLKWRILRRPFLETAIKAVLSSVNDPNWRTRSALLSYLRTFTYRHTFILSGLEKSQIWQTIEKLLVDSQVEVREHAAGVLASLMRGIDKDLSKDFRDRSYAQAQCILDTRRRTPKSGHSIATIHGAVLALTASVLSVPYDMPSWLPGHVTLLARFIREPSPIRSTVTKAVAEFKRTHADTWSIQKDAFTEDELEVLRDTSSSSSYFA